MSEQHTYTTSLTWKDTRRGEFSPPGLPPVEVATPPQFPGGIDGVWSPEHLFVASAEACIMTTFLAIAANSKVEFDGYASEAVGTLETVDGVMQITSIVVRVTITISDESKVDRVTRILEKSKEHCLISHSMKAKVTLDGQVSVA